MNWDNLTDAELIEYQKLIRERDIDEAKVSFWRFCQVMAPDFYQDHRFHLFELCKALQNLYEGKPQNDGKRYHNIMINMPPQFGKTRTMSMWVDWVLGQSTKERFILASYSDDPATDMSRNIRNVIAEEKNKPEHTVYSDIFPETKLKHGDSAVKRWSLEGEHFNFLAAGIIGGAVTGKGATIQIYDDLIKGREESLSSAHLEKVWGSYNSTFGTRKDASVQQPLKVMIATRWVEGDPCGKELEENPEDWYVVKMQAYDEESDSMLCDDFLNKEQYLKKKKKSKTSSIEEQLFDANFQQETIDKEMMLYSEFKTYDEIPPGIAKAKTDTADEGECYLCTICYDEDPQGYAYVTDVMYTQEGQETTEPLNAQLLIDNDTRIADYESNNGGKGFARAVKREYQDLADQAGLKNNIQINWYPAKGNKESRILSNAPTVNKRVIMPKGWKSKWPKFYDHVSKYKKKFKANKYHDAPDALTMIVEKDTGKFKVKKR